MIRTLWVTNDFPPRAGGIEQFLTHLLAGLDSDTVAVLTAPWPGHEAHDATLPYRVERVGRRPLLPTPRLAAAVRRAAAQHRAELVVFGAAWPLGELATSLSLPSLAITHGFEAGMTKVGLGPLLARVGRAVDAITYISAYTRTEIEPWLPPELPLFQLSPGVDVTLFRPDADGSEVRARHGIPADAPLAVCLSRLVRRKGQDALVEAWPLVLERVPAARLLLAGAGPMHDSLQRRIHALDLERMVTLAGEVSWDELPAYHAAGDVFAMPCRTRLGGLDVEGLGIVYLEAQACGKPVVVGRSGGAPEAVVDGETGIVTDGESAEAVAEAVASLLGAPDRARAMGVAGRSFVERQYAWPVVTRALEEALTVAVNGRLAS